MLSISPIKTVKATLLGIGITLGVCQISSCSNSDSKQLPDRNSAKYEYKEIPARTSYGKDLVYLPNNRIDTLQFNIDNLRQNYPDCNIIQKDSTDDWNSKIHKIVITDSKNNIRREIEVIEGDNMFNSYHQYNIFTPQNTTSYLIGEDALIRVTKTDNKNNKSTVYDYSYSSGNINSYSEDINDSVNVKAFYEDGKISYEVYTNKNKDVIQKRVLYNDGYKYKEIDDINERTIYILAEDLIEDLSDNIMGLSKINDNLKFDIYKRLNSDNLFETLKVYNKITKRDLIQDILDINNPLDIKEKDKLINYIQNLASMVNPETAEYAAEYLVEMLKNIHWGCEKINPEKYILLINGTNVGYFAKTYQEEMMASSGILSDINNNQKLSSSDKEKFISHIINAALKAGFNDKYDNFYAEDIKRDIKSHPNNLHKLDIDLRRMGNRPAARKYDTRNVSYTSPDGKINDEFCQGYSGDCWLISGLSAINNKSYGKKYLENLIELKPNSDIISVKLPGVKKEYSFHKWEADSAAYLAKGDGDIRAIEYAVDKYLKEQAYNNKSSFSSIDIMGNMSNEAFNILIGKPISTRLWFSMPYLYENFNSPDIIYLLGVSRSGSVIGKKCFAKTPEYHELLSHHSYTIVMSDEDYIYLMNPHDLNNTKGNPKEEYIRFSRKDLEGILAELTSIKIPHL